MKQNTKGASLLASSPTHSIFAVRPPLTLLDGDAELIFRAPALAKGDVALTIAIPTFKRPQLLREALTSLRNLKASNDFFVVVVDNDADNLDGRVEACVRDFADLSISLFRNSVNVGMFGNWNRCFLLAETQWVSILNDDDLLLPNFLEKFQSLLKACTDEALLQLGYGVLDERKKDAVPDFSYTAKDLDRPRHVQLTDLLKGNNRAGSLAMVFRKDVAVQLGGFDSSEYPTADYCFNVRILINGHRVLEDPSAAALYRVFENESLKPEVMAGFIANDYRLLVQCSHLFQCPSWCVRLFAYVRAVAYYHRLQKTWGVYPSRSALKASTGITTSNRQFESVLSRVLARIFVHAIN